MSTNTNGRVTPVAIPSFGQLLDYLRALGFSSFSRSDGVMECRESNSETILLFRNRALEEPTREHELLLTRVQLTYRDIVSEAEFDQFQNGGLQPAAPSA